MLEDLKKNVYQANIDLVKHGLVLFTWGNVSGIDRESEVIVIKPSGVSYETMEVDDMVVLNMDGKQIDGKLNPSSDAPTHLYLYRKFSNIGGIVHTHSEWATAWAQSRRAIPVYGTTHADYFYGEIPCTRSLLESEVREDYELNTGKVITETFEDLDPTALPGVLVGQHGPFSWGKDSREALHNAKVMEEVAKMAYYTEKLGNTESINEFLLEKHYQRKHGKDSYYGQS